jgi:hypothetical protein
VLGAAVAALLYQYLFIGKAGEAAQLVPAGD